MTQLLVVDSSRLKTAGDTLRGLAFPAPPPPIVAAGTDPVSAAISDTLLVIETPVTNGLRDLKAAVTRTGSSIVTAARIYADADQRLGDYVSRVQFRGADEKSAVPASMAGLAGLGGDQSQRAVAAQPVDGDTPSTPVMPVPPLAQPAPQLGGRAETVGNAARSVAQGVQAAMQNTAAGGAVPGQLAEDSKTEQSGTDQAQLADETIKVGKETQQPDALAEGNRQNRRSPEQGVASPL